MGQRSNFLFFFIRKSGTFGDLDSSSKMMYTYQP